MSKYTGPYGFKIMLKWTLQPQGVYILFTRDIYLVRF